MSLEPRYRALTINGHGTLREIRSSVKASIAFIEENIQFTDSRLVQTEALWDTGATSTAITKKFAAQLGLKPISMVECHHAGGVTRVPVYLINLYLDSGVAFPAIQVSELADTVGGFDILIGMDIICTGDFSITNFNGSTCMSFRHPSIAKIDYVDEYNRLHDKLENRLKTAVHTPSNALCPCGSGKKYKRCHGRK